MQAQGSQSSATPPTPAPPEPLAVSPRFARWVLAAVVAVTATLLAKQIVCWRIASSDACGFYLPLAEAFAEGRFDDAQHPAIPPLYPMVAGAVSRVLGWCDRPAERAGQLVSAASLLLVVLVVYRVGAFLAGRRAGLGAAALTAANPYLIRYGASVGPETFYALWLCLTVLLLLKHIVRPTWPTALALGACSALAALTRSEGIFLPAMCLAVMLVAVIVRAARAKAGRMAAFGRFLLHLAMLLAVVAAAWAPRAAGVRGRTGYFFLDVRMLRFVDPANHPDVRQFTRMPLEIARVDLNDALPQRPADEAISEAWQDLLIGVGPITWALLLIRLLAVRRTAAKGWGEWVIFAVLAVQFAVLASVKVGMRYVSTAAPLVQVWGGMGMVAMAEFLRARGGPAGRIGRSIPAQFVTMGAVVAALAGWSALSPNAGVRHDYLRRLGLAAMQAGGKDTTILAGDPEAAYYAAGRLVAVSARGPRVEVLSQDRLRALAREHDVDFVVLDPRDSWAADLLRDVTDGRIPPRAVLAKEPVDSSSPGKRTARTAYLLDAQALD